MKKLPNLKREFLSENIEKKKVLKSAIE